jgi:hypothetical protein
MARWDVRRPNAAPRRRSAPASTSQGRMAIRPYHPDTNIRGAPGMARCTSPPAQRRGPSGPHPTLEPRPGRERIVHEPQCYAAAHHQHPRRAGHRPLGPPSPERRPAAPLHLAAHVAGAYGHTPLPPRYPSSEAGRSWPAGTSVARTPPRGAAPPRRARRRGVWPYAPTTPIPLIRGAPVIARWDVPRPNAAPRRRSTSPRTSQGRMAIRPYHPDTNIRGAPGMARCTTPLGGDDQPPAAGRVHAGA